MKEPLSHSEIDRVIDEQERELDLLYHESSLQEEVESKAKSGSGWWSNFRKRSARFLRRAFHGRGKSGN